MSPLGRKFSGPLVAISIIAIVAILMSSLAVQHDALLAGQARSLAGSIGELLSVASTGEKNFVVSDGGNRFPSLNQSYPNSSFPIFRVQVTAIHIDKAEFPLSRLLFKLTLKLALEAAEKKLEPRRVKLSLSFRSASTCSRQYAGAVAAEEYYTRRARLFVVSGCDEAIRGISRLASGWGVPVMTAAGFGADLNDKSVHKTLVRIAFSLRTAVEFLIKILKSFQWQRVNLIVDESDANSLALRESIEQHLVGYKSKEFQVTINVVAFDLLALTNQSSLLETATATATTTTTSSKASTTSTTTGNRNESMSKATHWTNRTTATAATATTTGGRISESSNEDKWPNEPTERAVRDALKQSSLFSRVSILLIPQHYLRKFMLSAYDQNMANGLYTFINMPLLLIANDEQVDTSATAAAAAGNSPKQSYTTTSTGENVFVWRSLSSSRNSQARQAFESLMSIYLRTPTSKAYVYFTSELSNLINFHHATSAMTQPSVWASSHRQQQNSKETRGQVFQAATTTSTSPAQRAQLTINPYSASFYDCLQIYASILDESLRAIERATDKSERRRLKTELHARVSSLVRGRRYDNMVTGTIMINDNGDRETDYTLDDLNQMTGKFSPVIWYKSDLKEIERVNRIHWSSDSSVGPTVDSVDCQLTGTCPSKPLSRFLVTLILLAAPLGLVMGSILYIVYQRISLESQLVDYWWKINSKDIEMVATRRKNAGDGSSVVTGGSQVSSAKRNAIENGDSGGGAMSRAGSGASRSRFTDHGPDKTVITKVTDTSAFASTAADVCYGNISLGIYKLAKVALKPISKFHQTRKLMIELRTIKGISHNNLCRFVGIVVDESNMALVNEFCPKGSLREFFQNESMVIDWTFKYSIINDIIAGLLYLHSSQLEYHGRLKSSNCLVSSRFVVKISDFGLHSLHEQLDDNEDEMTLMRKRLWLAPEHMKSGANRGSKKGDVYSFGLLLYEIITNNLPFYNAEKNDFVMPLKTLFHELKANGPSEKVGPNLDIIDTSQNNIEPLVELMKSCWQHDANKRPSSLVLGTALKKITHGVTSKKLLENLTGRMEQYTNNLESLVDAKLATLVEEKLKTEELLYQFVPKSIASLLKEGQSVEPEAFECVTVFYSDIVGFTSLSSESSPMEVIDFLSDLYLCFDETLEQYDIFKVDTIGDAYIVASGLPQRNDGKHVIEIARAALELRERLAGFKIPHKPGRSLEMRVGIHSGPCVAGIVGGLNMPKYCVFGDTLSIGKFMESSGQPMKIHVTEQSKNLLAGVGGFKIEPRLPRISKDGLPFQTYWLDTE